MNARRGRPRTPHTALIVEYPCPVCDAGPGDLCRRLGSNVTSYEPHTERVDLAYGTSTPAPPPTPPSRPSKATTARPVARWRVVVTSYPCPTCGAAAGELCNSRYGTPAHEPHAPRARLASENHWQEAT